MQGFLFNQTKMFILERLPAAVNPDPYGTSRYASSLARNSGLMGTVLFSL